MSYRKVNILLEVVLCVDMDEGIDVADVINELEYDFTSGNTAATVTDSEIVNHEVIDSR